MKKLLCVFLIFALLLCGGCGRQGVESGKEEPVVQAQEVANEKENTEAAEREEKEEIFSGTPLEQTTAPSEPGDIPDPEPVQPPSAEK